jgi:hypothetical protein
MARIFGPINVLSQNGAQVRINAGTIDKRQEICILGQSSMEVYVLRGNRLEASPLAEFIEGYLLGQVTSQVYQSTYWIVPVGNAVMVFAMALAGGAFAGAALATANLVQLAAKAMVMYRHCPGQVATATRELPRVLAELGWLAVHCPRFFLVLQSVMVASELRAIRDYRPSADDAAEMIGGLLAGGLAGNATKFGFAGLLSLLGEAAMSLAPAVAQAGRSAYHGALPAAVGANNGNADIYLDLFRSKGMQIADVERRAIRSELQQANAASHLHDLKSHLALLAPAMRTILQNWPAA